MPRKKKLLFAPVDMGYRVELYTKFIEKYYSDKLDVESLVIFLVPQEHYKTGYTFQYHSEGKNALYRWTRSFFNFIFCLFRYDIFHFFSGETLLTRKLRRFELMVYKLFRKRIIMHFVGADIRSIEYILWKEKNMQHFLEGKDDFPKSLPWQKELIRDVEKFADSILVSSPDLIEVVPSAVYYPVVLDLDKFLSELDEANAKEKDPGEIVILHCPSNILLKGSNFIHETLKKIASKGNWKIRLILPAEKMIETPKVYSVTRYELYKLYKEADIVIDQMVIGWYGLQSIEAVAAGKQTICYVDKYLEQFLYTDCPIRIANINTLEDAIEECIENIINRTVPQDINSLEWVRKYHTIENNNRDLLAAWNISH